MEPSNDNPFNEHVVGNGLRLWKLIELALEFESGQPSLARRTLMETVRDVNQHESERDKAMETLQLFALSVNGANARLKMALNKLDAKKVNQWEPGYANWKTEHDGVEAALAELDHIVSTISQEHEDMHAKWIRREYDYPEEHFDLKAVTLAKKMIANAEYDGRTPVQIQVGLASVLHRLKQFNLYHQSFNDMRDVERALRVLTEGRKSPYTSHRTLVIDNRQFSSPRNLEKEGRIKTVAKKHGHLK